MSQPDFGDLVARAQEVQSKLAALQRELATRRVEASSGGGMVTAVATGGMRIVEIRIEPSLIQGQDLEMIQDLTAAAVNAALAAAQQLVQDEMQRISGDLGVAGMPVPGGTE